MKLLLAALPLMASAFPMESDYTVNKVTGEACHWVSAVYGDMIFCNPGEIMTGVCGSGYRSDCDHGKYWYMIQCCEAGSAEQHNCQIEHSKYGDSAKCPGDRPGAYGGCGSGKNADCNTGGHKDWNELQCCEKEDIRMYTDSDSCLTYYGYHGDKAECPHHYGIHQVCGSGMNKDCSGNTIKIKCCPYDIV